MSDECADLSLPPAPREGVGGRNDGRIEAIDGIEIVARVPISGRALGVRPAVPNFLMDSMGTGSLDGLGFPSW